MSRRTPPPPISAVSGDLFTTRKHKLPTPVIQEQEQFQKQEKSLLQLCSGQSHGSFGCFITKSELLKHKDFILQYCNISLQNPVDLKRKTTGLSKYDRTRLTLGKTIKHTKNKLTPEQKESFLTTLENTDHINGLKVLLNKPKSFNTFDREILRYREMLNDANIPVTTYAVKQLDSNISFSIIINKKRLDFIFLETCQTTIDKGPKINFREFLLKMVTDIQLLHNQNIIHMDIKPLNIMSCNGIYKLIDYGVSYGIPSNSDEMLEDIKIYVKYLATLYPQGTRMYFNPVMIMLLQYTQIGLADYISNIIMDINSTYNRYIVDMPETFMKQITETFMKQYPTITTAPDLKNLLTNDINNLKHLYLRHDWYSLAITLLYIYNKFTNLPRLSSFKRGILKLVSLTEEELNSHAVDKLIMKSFGYRSMKSRLRSFLRIGKPKPVVGLTTQRIITARSVAQ